MPTPIEAQIETIVKAAVDKAVADTTERLTAQFEQSTAALRKNRDEILAEKRRLEGKPLGDPPAKRTHDRNGQPFDRWYTPEDEDRFLAWEAEQKKAEGKPRERKPQPDVRTGEAIFITREAARDANRYRAAREQAEKAGKPLRVVDDSETAGVDRATGLDLRAERPERIRHSTLRSFDDRIHGVRYLRRDQVGQSPIRHRMAAERDGMKLVLFSSVDDLDENAQAAYREAGGET